MNIVALCVIPAALVAVAGTRLHAQLTLLPAGPMIGTHAGNLVVNGSFEDSVFGPGIAPGSAVRFWATGTSGTPTGTPIGWTGAGAPVNYATWGRDGGGPPARLRNSDVLPDGGNALYFGNGQAAFTTTAPTFNPGGEVTFAIPGTVATAYPAPVVLTQTVNTHLAPAASYILSFWVSGESSGFASPSAWDGIFGLRVTNTAAGDPVRYFAVPSGASALGMSHRFEFSFVPLNPLSPVTLEFINWGHFNLGPWGMGGTTELVLDDVIVNPVPTPAPVAGLAFMGLTAMRRRR